MSYCRHCGTEINYTRTANGRWMPYDVTGQPHFCQEDKNNNTQKKSGLEVCKTCGKPVFIMNKKKIDYTTLNEHTCKKADITRFQKYNERKRKLGK